MKFARWVFTIGGIWGVLIIGPLFFLEGSLASASEPFTHPDMYYGFVASTFAWQLAYLAIGRDPARYRPMMLIGSFGKVVYFSACWALFLTGRVPMLVPLIASPDIVLAILFVTAWFRTRGIAAA